MFVLLQLWTDCYHFWRALQDYNEHFFCDTFNPDLIKQKAGVRFQAILFLQKKVANTVPLELFRVMSPFRYEACESWDILPATFRFSRI